MSTHKKIDMLCIISVILSIALSVFLLYVKGDGSVTAMSKEAGSGMFTAADLDACWDTASATKIALSDKGSKIDGSGAYVDGGDIHIVYGGRYVLTGSLTDGSVIIDADKSDKVWILSDGVSVHADDDAAVRVEQADKVFLTLADNTESSFSSGERYNEDAAGRGVDGVIYSRDDLTINGTGSLLVEAGYRHGIVCNDDLVISGGNITVSAPQDGVHTNDSVRICKADISIAAGDDGITVSNDDETASLYVESGSIVISDCYEGFEAVDITIAGGMIDIMSTDDGINASGSGENSVIRITGGEVRIVNSTGRDADGLDSNGNIYIEGGKVFISVPDDGGNCAIDYGRENGGECVISGGTVIACGGSAMAEGFDAVSPQGFIMHNTSAQAGTTIRLEDADGRVLLREEIPCSFSSAVLSTPDLAVGDVCIVTVGEEKTQITIDNVASSGVVPAGRFGGGMRDGEKRGEMPEFQGPADKRKMRGDEKNPFAVDGEHPKEPEEHFQKQRQMPPAEDSASVHISPETWIFIGISVLFLLTGLFIAGKIKH